MLIGKMFNKDVFIDENRRLTIVIGENGAGKTYLLDTLNDFFKERNENVLYLGEDRYFHFEDEKDVIDTLESAEVLNGITGIKDRINLDKMSFELNHLIQYKDKYISSGSIQWINFLYNFEKAEQDTNLLIDLPERNLDFMKSNAFLNKVLSYDKFKRIFIATHSPTLIKNSFDDAIDIDLILSREEDF